MLIVLLVCFFSINDLVITLANFLFCLLILRHSLKDINDLSVMYVATLFSQSLGFLLTLSTIPMAIQVIWSEPNLPIFSHYLAFERTSSKNSFSTLRP